MNIDPVCRMLIHRGKAAATSEQNGINFYFCSPRCQQDFDKNPDGYIGIKSNDKKGRYGFCAY